MVGLKIWQKASSWEQSSYEFKPKEKSLEQGSKILERTETQVKNLLSGYLKNLKSNKINSDIPNEEKINHKISNNINSNNNNKIGDISSKINHKKNERT